MDNQSTNVISGGPTKRFFVEMITKDIELDDAILDLLDNSIDGAIREIGARTEEENCFDGYKATLEINDQFFRLSDNCGGITDDYIEDAFSLGRPTISKDSDIPTIGMFGIGMKRAVFKIGNSAKVTSNSEDGFRCVEYTTEWMNPDNKDWELNILKKDRDEQLENGVEILIDNLREDISRTFGNPSFIEKLHTKISEYFAYLIEKGFQVILNGQLISPALLKVVFSEPDSEEGIAISPYYFENTTDGVNVKVIVGFHRPLAREHEIDLEAERPTSADLAGITVVCNDRVIILRDKSMRTGWGDGAPQYHSQFRAISGLIVFSSSDASKLPISTTKRGINIESDIYYKARSEAITGIKTFTSFTNKWKGMEAEANSHFKLGEIAGARSRSAQLEAKATSLRGKNGKRLTPNLPTPSDTNPKQRVSFVRTKRDIKLVSQYLFDDENQKPSEIGYECFERALVEAKKV